MKFELVKTIILTFLVGLSFLLTFAIWNYDRSFDTADNTDQSTEAVLKGAEENKESLLEPYQMVFHRDGTIVGFAEKEKELDTFQYVSQLHLYDFRMLDDNDSSGESESGNYVEIIFPTSMPSSYIREIFSSDEPSEIDTEFKSIKLFLDQNRETSQIIFENSDPYGIDIRANIQNLPQVIKHFDEVFTEGEFITYLPVEVRNDQTVYLPQDPNIKGKQFRYTTINTDSETFQSIFFLNPQDVQSSPNPEGGQTYSDGSRGMLVRRYFMEFTDYSTNEFSQSNQSEGMPLQSIGDQLLTNSIEHINSHNGWLKDEDQIEYRLYDLDVSSEEIEYRMTYNNYPVFSLNSSQDIATMSLEYLNGKLFKYSRPLMILTQSYDRSDKKLMTADELVSFLEESEHYSLDRILNIQLGYRIEQQAAQVFDLIPTWSVQTYNGWQVITKSMVINQGGQTNAMGTN
ncbi:hypothetical protein F9U64_10040 [Gracilibacillus oryzae]|uniref:Regulatory protein YycH domain-containing protein n=1 Tax=Gracilibacillus oryzae TaxID=1672701 RepID=A0A7C8GTG1_9BACI|nr:two-component system activity regulator YycH [Gracilibacillus oryzae]KAB8136830.1 hypothetical protein F9U64_10040 [Gracilibacillus oryzae]